MVDYILTNSQKIAMTYHSGDEPALGQSMISFWATSCCVASQAMPMAFESCHTVSFQLFLGIPGFRFAVSDSHCIACLGSLSSSILKRWPAGDIAMTSLISIMIKSMFCLRSDYLVPDFIFPYHYQNTPLELAHELCI